MNKALNFGVQSYCFRHFKDNHTVAALVREIGLESIELCAVHADFSDPDGFREVVGIYQEAEVAILSIGVETFTGNPAEESRFKCAALAGATHISCHFQPDSFLKAIPMVRAWSRHYGIRVGIHCHGGYNFNGNVETLKYLLALGTPEIGLCLDTAWAMQTGPHHGNPVDWVRKHFSGQVYGVHYKDFLFGRDGMWEDVVVGTGNLDLPGLVKALGETGFDGMAVIEYEADVEDPAPALKRCVESMRASTGA
ncbi:MAG TPA: sugar phosphate isomerase/epimerase [Oceanipulchritudo sp.]|nr:sugar phosphate isomerase/epimerase [Oceanipulchritudo sp.]